MNYSIDTTKNFIKINDNTNNNYYYKINDNTNNNYDDEGKHKDETKFDIIEIGKIKYNIIQYTLFKNDGSIINSILTILKDSTEFSGGSKQNKTKFRKSKNNRKSRKNIH